MVYIILKLINVNKCEPECLLTFFISSVIWPIEFWNYEYASWRCENVLNLILTIEI